MRDIFFEKVGEDVLDVFEGSIWVIGGVFREKFNNDGFVV